MPVARRRGATRPRPGRWSAVAALLTITLLAPRAGAETLEGAREAYLDAEFRRATEAFEAVLRQGELRRSEAAEAYAYLAALLLLSGQEAVARQHATAAVALSPGVAAPDGAPEELLELMDEQRQRTGGRPVRLRIGTEEPPRPGVRLLISASLEPPMTALARELSLRCVDADRSPSPTERGAPPAVSLELTPEAGPIDCEAVLIGLSGLPLLRTVRQLEVTRSRSPWLWVGIAAGAVAVVAIVVGLAVGLTTGDAQIDGLWVEGW